MSGLSTRAPGIDKPLLTYTIVVITHTNSRVIREIFLRSGTRANVGALLAGRLCDKGMVSYERGTLCRRQCGSGATVRSNAHMRQ